MKIKIYFKLAYTNCRGSEKYALILIAYCAGVICSYCTPITNELQYRLFLLFLSGSFIVYVFHLLSNQIISLKMLFNSYSRRVLSHPIYLPMRINFLNQPFVPERINTCNFIVRLNVLLTSLLLNIEIINPITSVTFLINTSYAMHDKYHSTFNSI